MQEDWKKDLKFIVTLLLTLPGIVALIFSVPDEFRFVMSMIVIITIIFAFLLLFNRNIFSALSKSRQSFRTLLASIGSPNGQKLRHRITTTFLIANACVAFAYLTVATIATNGFSSDVQLNFNPIFTFIGITSMLIMFFCPYTFKLPDS